MRELTSREFNNGGVMTYSRGIGVESKVTIYKEHGVYHIKFWNMVQDETTPNNCTWRSIEGVGAHAQAIKEFRLLKRYIDASFEAKIKGYVKC